jgi:hypothetical protein
MRERDTGHTPQTPTSKPENPKETVKMAKKTVEVTTFPEVGFFADLAAFKKHVKGLTDEQILEWVGLNNLTVKNYESAPINRMRRIMAIKELHFPTPEKPAKTKSPYSKYETEELVQMAVDNEVLFEVCDDPKILRMRAIMALRAHHVIE